MQNLKVQGREFTVEGPTPRYRTYILTGDRGAEYLAVPAFIGNDHIFKVIGGRYFNRPLYINGNAVMLSDESGELREAVR